MLERHYARRRLRDTDHDDDGENRFSRLHAFAKKDCFDMLVLSVLYKKNSLAIHVILRAIS